MAIGDQEITIKGSSGSLWYLDFPKSKQDHFQKVWSKDLQIGMTVGGSVLQHIDDLDNRHVANQYVYSLKKY